jgi:uncharacterized membrane protein YphA (DoxX/SURF4 family)
MLVCPIGSPHLQERLPLAASRTTLAWPAALAIVLLRFVVGAHFFHEGYTKWRDPKPFSAPVFAAAKGPFADFYHGMVWDPDGRGRLDEKETFRIWGVSINEKGKPELTGKGYLGAAIAHFRFDQEQADKAGQIVLARVTQYRDAVELWTPEIKEYEYGLEWRKYNAADASRKLDSIKKHDARIATELTAKRMPWQADIDRIWTGLERDINELADRSHVDGDTNQPRLSSRGYLKIGERPGQQAFDTTTMDRYVPYFDMTIGVLLVAGLFTRVAASLAAAFLASIVASQWPFASDAISTGYQQVEICALLVLATIGAGRYAGLDALLGECCKWCCRRPNGGASTTASGERTPAASESEKRQLVGKA